VDTLDSLRGKTEKKATWRKQDGAVKEGGWTGQLGGTTSRRRRGRKKKDDDDDDDEEEEEIGKRERETCRMMKN